MAFCKRFKTRKKFCGKSVFTCLRIQKKNHLNLNEVYKMLGCSKQNISYWRMHSYSTQSKKSLYEIIRRAEFLFDLSAEESETLFNSAGLSLEFEGGDPVKVLGYHGKLTDLCRRAMISDRMLRLYKQKTPTKQTLTALAVVLNKNSGEIDELLHKYGYCLSDSIIADVVVKWYLKENKLNDGEILIFSINETLEKMGLPLLMTKQS